MNKLTLCLFNMLLLLYLCCVYGAAVSVLLCECVLCVSILKFFSDCVYLLWLWLSSHLFWPTAWAAQLCE